MGDVERDKKIYMLVYQINVFLCKGMGHIAKECSLSRKGQIHVVNDEPQTSVGGSWVQVAKRHMINPNGNLRIICTNC